MQTSRTGALRARPWSPAILKAAICYCFNDTPNMPPLFFLPPPRISSLHCRSSQRCVSTNRLIIACVMRCNKGHMLPGRRKPVTVTSKAEKSDLRLAQHRIFKYADAGEDIFNWGNIFRYRNVHVCGFGTIKCLHVTKKTPKNTHRLLPLLLDRQMALIACLSDADNCLLIVC